MSNTRQERIVRHFVLSSPPSEARQVVDDCKKIYDVSAEVVKNAMKEHNEASYLVVDVRGGPSIVCAAAAREDRYLDPKRGILFGVDHRKQSATTVEDFHEDQVYRAAIQEHLDRYLAEHYDNAVGIAFEQNGAVEVVISVINGSAKNFWSGAWSSTWSIQLREGRALLSGEVRVKTHYYEVGNMQVNHTQAASHELDSDLSTLGSAVVEFIKKTESEVHLRLQLKLAMIGETMCTMRRVLPMTKQRFQWNLQKTRMINQVNSMAK